MRIMFVYYLMDQGGSAQDIYHYSRAARDAGHELVVYGPPRDGSPFAFSKDIESADAVFFIFEWTQAMRHGDAVDLARLIGRVPRHRRFVIDCDGNYNDCIAIDGDYNHRDEAASLEWTRICHSVSDQIFQPTTTPRRPNVRPFFFHGYDPAWERPIRADDRDYAMVYVGHSRFRWGPMSRTPAIEPLRGEVGRIALVGHGWDAVPEWAGKMGIEECFYTDPDYLRRLDVEFIGEVPFGDVLAWMGRCVFSPVLYRPLFRHLGMVTCRTFETPASGSIPLFDLDPGYVSALYGQRALELILPAEKPAEKIRDIFDRPEHYADIVMDVRRVLAARHSFAARFQELLGFVEA